MRLVFRCRALCCEHRTRAVQWVWYVMDELGTRKEVEYAFKILEEGSSADRQIRAFHAAGDDPKAVVDMLIAETEDGVI